LLTRKTLNFAEFDHLCDFLVQENKKNTISGNLTDDIPTFSIDMVDIENRLDCGQYFLSDMLI
jgi:hypothetical protein